MAANNTKDSEATTPSLMALKFANSNGQAYPRSSPTTSKWTPRYYFVYGTLMDPKQAQTVLRREEPPQMFSATLEGWTIKMWGAYPALINEIGPKIYGKAFEVQSMQEAEYLQHYETAKYSLQSCWIDIEGRGKECSAQTFLWNGRLDELKDGTFDLKDWHLQKLDK